MKILEKYQECKRRYHEQRKITLAISGLSIAFDWFFILIFVIVVGAGLFFFASNLYLSVDREIAGTNNFEQTRDTITIGEIREIIKPLSEQKPLKIKVESTIVPLENFDQEQDVVNREGE